MKKVIAIVLCLVMCVGALAACSNSTESKMKVGFIFLHDENSTYDLNFLNAAKETCEKLGVEYILRTNIPEDQKCKETAEDLIDQGCTIIFADSFGHEDYLIEAAKDHPEVQFCHATGTKAHTANLANFHNAFASIYEGRYLAGIAAGMKLNEMIASGKITADQAKMGYVGAFTYAEVISGYTSFYLGAKSVCPSATMKVEFIGSWGDPTMEANTAQDLIDKGCVLISQHSDSTTPATTAQSNGVYHVGYNISMIDVAPDASLSSSRIDWTNYFVYVIETAVNGGTVDPDYTGHGLKDGDVALCELNEAIAAPGTEETVQAAKAAIEAGELHVFDTSKFTVGGQEATSALVDMTGDFVGDEGYDAIFDGYYHESYFKSAPAFDLRIDGIELLNEAY